MLYRSPLPRHAARGLSRGLHGLLVALALAVLPGAILPAAAQQQPPAEPGPSEVFIEQAAEAPLDVEVLVPISRGEALAEIRRRLSTPEPNPFGAFLTDNPGGNFARLDQHGAGNRARLDQRGASNVAVLALVGSGNTTRLEQAGSGNLYGGFLTGSGNTLEVVQRGRDNVYLLDVQGSGLAHSVRQLGTGLQAAQRGDGGVPFSIEQRGDGMNVFIEHNLP